MRWSMLLGSSCLMLSAAGQAQQLPAPRSAAASDNVLLTAEDAFGERVGIEQVGLYSESQSRGFSLTNTGAYRIDGSYYVPTSGLTDSLVGGVSIRLGVNAARLDFPSPSGVVNYRLRTPTPGEQLSLTVGDRHFGSFFAELNGSFMSKDGRVGIAGGAFARPHVNRPIGGEGEDYYAGVVPVWQPTDTLRIRGLAGHRQSRFDGGYSFRVTEHALASKLESRTLYAPDWSDAVANDQVLGAIADFAPMPAVRLTASTFYTRTNSEFSDLTLLTVRPDGRATATQIRTPDRRFTSLASEARASYRFETGAIDHAVSIGVRGRDTRSKTTGGTQFDLGTIDLADPRFPDEPAFTDNGLRVRDMVDQRTGSVSYTALISDKLELRGGLHLTRYEKNVTPPGGQTTSRTDGEWLNNLSAIYLWDPKTTLFASYVKGLEEAGVAPQNAVNRGDILPPVIAKQYELGFRRKLASSLTLIGAVFDISKPTAGLRSDGRFTFVGQVRHRGAELSLNGRVGPGTSIVAGAVAMKPRLSGELVDNGSVGGRPAGIPPVTAFVSVDQRMPLKGVSLDARLSYQSKRPANTLNTLDTPGYATLDVGGRYSFPLGKSSAVLRATLTNALNEREWVAGGGGTMSQTLPRFLRASLTVALVGR